MTILICEFSRSLETGETVDEEDIDDDAILLTCELYEHIKNEL